MTSNAPASARLLSATQLAKSLGVLPSAITGQMEKSGLIQGDTITEIGRSKGLVIKSYMGKDYISYPEDLQELSPIKLK